MKVVLSGKDVVALLIKGLKEEFGRDFVYTKITELEPVFVEEEKEDEI